MPDPRPASQAGPLPRGHLLALNRSFRRTLEAENKSPRTIEAYTDAVRLLTIYMALDDVDLDQRIVWVLGKGRRPRALPVGRKTAQALDRYLRAREGHRLAHLPHLWVGRNGPMTPSGVYQVVHDRARAAGLPAMHPHQLRHAFATSWLAEGGNENELMLVAGWKSRIMIDRYTKATAVERARASHARLSPGDRL
jgi:site-specific recombinase XerD